MKKFAFLIHALNLNDVVRFEPKAAGKRQALVEKILEWMPSYKASHITGIRSKATGEEIEGWFVAVPLLPHQFMTMDRKYVMGKIIEGGKIAEKLGASILGLGGFTSVVGDAGYTIAKNLSIPVTSGNSYTIATAMQGALEAARLLGINPRNARAAVIGASGSIGKVCSRMLAREVKSLTLVARNLNRLKLVAESIDKLTGRRPEISTAVSYSIKDADIVISATSSGEVIKAQDLKSGSLVCDVALPHDVCRDVAVTRPDVMVIEGGIVQVPGDPDFHYDFGYPPKISMACMAETFILTLEGRFENYSIGRGIKIEQVEEIASLAVKHGFTLAGFRSFDQPVRPEQIESVRSHVRQSSLLKAKA